MTVRRLQRHAADSGYVYEYYFVGQRPAAGAMEYVFDVSVDRKTIYAVSVLVRTAALEAWAERHGRELSGAEQYAAAKLRLLAGLDEIADIAAHSRRLMVEAENVEELLAGLGLE